MAPANGVEALSFVGRHTEMAIIDQAIDRAVEGATEFVVIEGAAGMGKSRLLAEVHRTGRPRGAHDLIIAATSVSSERTLLTADARGFEDLPGVEVHILGR